MFAQVAVDVPLFTALTYAIPEPLLGIVRPGQLVQVPFRNRAKTGLVVGLTDALDDPELEAKVRPLLDVLDEEPLLSERGIEFLRFVADYYIAAIGEVMRLALPSAVRVEGIKHYTLRGEPAADALQGMPVQLLPVLEELRQAPDAASRRPVRELKEAHGLTYHDLGELERRGLVDVHYEDDATVRARTERFYRLAQEPSARIGSKQAEILELLRGEEDGVALSEIRDRIDNPHSSLNSLESRGVVEWWEEEVYRDPFRDSTATPPRDVEPTTAQVEALAAIGAARDAGRFEGFVLHGVTGSGKTEVYVRAIRETIAVGKRALVLLPEIALTPQFVSIFRGHFGDAIAVLHSGLSTAEKFDQWRRIRRDEVDIVIGARSAIFAPVNDLGILVVDEEHDPSFKQEEGPRYNARDMALVRGKLEAVPVVLGSATPSLESFQNAREERLTYLPMPDRVAGRPLPEVELVDLRGQPRADGLDDEPSYVSPELHGALQATMEAGRQAIIFLNRRGYSPCVVCDACGHRWPCPNCDVSLTYHRRQESLRCHHCDYSLRLPEICPVCGQPGIGPKGVGTEKLEGYLHTLFPDRVIARLDRDTSSGKSLRHLIRRFGDGEIDILVGTQMVTKGHDFPNVATVGVVLADLGLNFPDFRAAERTFQLMTQVAGRAGRGEVAGRVYVQTYDPEHYALRAALRHDFHAFSEHELELRRALAYPPFGHLIAVKFEAAHDSAVARAARDYAFAARRRLRQSTKEKGGDEGVKVLGPALAPLERLRGKTRWQLLFQSLDRGPLRRLVLGVLHDMGYFDVSDRRHKNVRIVVDVDPISML